MVALLWICHSLRHDPHVMGNEPLMAAHTIMLLLSSAIYWIVAGSHVETHIIYGGLFAKNYILLKILAIASTIVYLLMAYIMDQTNRP